MATTENPVPAQAEDNVSKPGASGSGSGSGSDTEVPKESESSKEDWAFKNSEPLREDQIQNAVKFLSHPKVRGSPVVHRRSFLERKGLTKEEIDEAFTRVPDPLTSDVPAVLPARTQPQDAKPPVVAAAPTQQLGNMNQHIIPGAVPQPIVKANQFTWRNVVFAIGFLAATGAGAGFLFKKTIVPKMKTWIRKVISDTDDHEQKKALQPDPAAEAAAAAKSAAEAAAAVAIATQELLKNKSEDRKYFEGLVQTLEEQVEEMKYIKISVQSNENNRHNISASAKRFDGVLENESSFGGKQNGSSGMVSSMNQNSKINYTPVLDQGSARSSSAPPTGMASRAPYSQSYMEVMEMISRGEKPPGIQDINDKPPNPNQPPSASQLQSRPKPWEKEQNHMLNRGSERNGYSDMHIKSSGSITNASGDFEPWWQQKNSDTGYREPRSQISDGNATKSKFDSAQEKINGNESEIHLNNFATGEQKSQGSSSFLNSGSRNWVPPQAPPLSMPQAAEAIRNPKTKMRKDVWDSKSEVSSDSLSDVQSGPNDGTLTSPENQDPEHVYSQSESQDYAKDNKPVMESSTYTEVESSDCLLQDTVTKGIKELEDV